jgi:hypothetical protein
MTSAHVAFCGLCGASWTMPPDQLWDSARPCPFCCGRAGAAATPPPPGVVATTMAALPVGSNMGGVSQQNTITITVSQHLPPASPGWPEIERRAAAPEMPLEGWIR